MSNTADAIVVIDLQKGVCFDSSPIHELETVTALVNKRIKTYETIGKPVIFVQHEDDQLVPQTNHGRYCRNYLFLSTVIL